MTANRGLLTAGRWAKKFGLTPPSRNTPKSYVMHDGDRGLTVEYFVPGESGRFFCKLYCDGPVGVGTDVCEAVIGLENELNKERNQT